MSRYGRVVYLEAGRPGAQGVRVEGLKLSFRVVKDETSSPNQTEVTVWGLSEETAAVLQDEESLVQLYAGHGEDVSLLSLTSVWKSRWVPDGKGTKLVLKSSDGKSLSRATASVSVQGETTLGSVLTNTLKAGVENPLRVLRAIRGDTTARKLLRGQVVRAPVRTALVRLGRANRFDWIAEDGELRIIGRDEALGLPALLVTPDTGLVGYPEPVKIGSQQGIKITLLIDGRARVRRLLKLESATYQGFFLIRRLEHAGDSGFDQKCYTTVWCTEVVPVPPAPRRVAGPYADVLESYATKALAGIAAISKTVNAALPEDHYVFQRPSDGKYVVAHEMFTAELREKGFTPTKATP